MNNFIFIIIALLLVLLNAFFVAAEFGLVKLRQTRITVIKKKYGWRGTILASVHRHLDAYLSACQLGITLASLGLGWIGEPAFAHILEPIFTYFALTPEMIKFISFAIAFTFISFLHIVLGEILPKSIALRQAEKISVWTAAPLYGFYWLMYPAIWILNSSSNFFMRLLKMNTTQHRESYYATEEIRLILGASQSHGELSKDEAEILEQTLDFADLKVTELMRPQQEMVTLSLQQPLAEIYKIAEEHRYSRYPVYDKNEEIVGIVHVKDLFAALYQQQPLKSIKHLIRPILKVSPRLPALNLLRKFREGMPHFALVYQGGEVLGFVTLDNLLHILIGRIKDEFHRTQDDWVTNADGSLQMKGDCSIYSLERALDRDIDLSRYEREPQTISGLILQELGRLPHKGERIQFPGFHVFVKKMNGSRIVRVRIVDDVSA